MPAKPLCSVAVITYQGLLFIKSWISILSGTRNVNMYCRRYIHRKRKQKQMGNKTFIWMEIKLIPIKCKPTSTATNVETGLKINK